MNWHFLGQLNNTEDTKMLCRVRNLRNVHRVVSVEQVDWLRDTWNGQHPLGLYVCVDREGSDTDISTNTESSTGTDLSIRTDISATSDSVTDRIRTLSISSQPAYLNVLRRLIKPASPEALYLEGIMLLEEHEQYNPDQNEEFAVGFICFILLFIIVIIIMNYLPKCFLKN